MTQLVQDLLLGLLLGGVYALVAGGLTLIFGVMRVINVAHGAFLILSAFITYTLWDAAGIDPLLSILVTTPLVFVLGWVTYKVLVAPIRTAPMVSTVLLTFGLALVLEGVMGNVWGNNSTAVRPSYSDESFTDRRDLPPEGPGVRRCRRRAACSPSCTSILTMTWLGRAIRAAAINLGPSWSGSRWPAWPR